jgi:cytochrome c oxidase assembly factor CtaG
MAVLAAWAWDPVPSIGVLCTGALYAFAWRRAADAAGHRRGRSHRPAVPRGRAVCFGLGLLAVVVAVDGPPDVLAESSFLLHMTQHMLLQMVAAPLLLLGGPIGLLLRADPRWCPRRTVVRLLRSTPVRLLTHPVTAFTLFTAMLVGSHLSPLYEIALRHEGVHQLEHLGYLVTALLFWWPAIGVDPAPRRLTPPARVLYLFLSMPVTALLGVSIAVTNRVLYPSYLLHLPPWGGSALADQQAAGTLLWVSGMFTVVPAMGAVLWRWLEEDAARQRRSESRADIRVAAVVAPADRAAGLP